MVKTTRTFNEGETISLGREFACHLHIGDVVALHGELGAGKTQFVKGLCLGLGVTELVASPSFVIMNEYQGIGNGGSTLSVFHFDFYRVRSLKEVSDLGIEDYLCGRGICLIEWADIARTVLPKNRYEVNLSILEDPDAREIKIERLKG